MDRISRWIESSDVLHRELLPLYSVLNGPSFADPNLRTLMNLSSACHRTTGSALVLIENQKLWDAEILMRSVLEGTVKFLFLLSEKNAYADRLYEFSDVLPDISRIKTHDRAKAIIDIVKTKDSIFDITLMGLILSDAEYEQLKLKYPRRQKQAIDYRWGFVQLLEKLSRSDHPIASFFPMLLHGYGMASHLPHADAIGVDMVHERENRSDQRRSLGNLAEIARVILDANSYTYLRLLFAYRFANLPTEAIQDIWKRSEPHFLDIEAAQAEWTQVEFRRRPVSKKK